MNSKAVSALKNYWFVGIIFIALGIVMIVWPNITPTALCITIAVLLMVMGLYNVVHFFTVDKEEHKVLDLLLGILAIAGGVIILVRRDFFIQSFQIVSSVVMLYGVILMFINAVRLRKEKGVFFILSLVFGILTLLFAVALILIPIFDSQSHISDYFTIVHAVGLIVEGLAMIIVLRKIQVSKKEEKALVPEKAPEGPEVQEQEKTEK